MNKEIRILVVEDQREWQVEIKELLLKLDQPYSVKIADNALKASDLLKYHAFDVVLLDLRLKDWEEGNFDGWSLMDELANNREKNGTQTIIISAYGEHAHVREGFKKYKIADFIDKKRLDPVDFIKSVTDAINKAQKERDNMVGKR